MSFLAGWLLYVLLVIASILPPAPQYTPRQAQPVDPPAIAVAADGGVSLPYSVGLNIWNGAVYDRLPTLGIYQEEHRKKSLPVVPLGATIRIAFDGDPPDGWTLYDFAYGAHWESRTLPLDFEGGTAAFTLTAFPEELLDAISVEHKRTPDPRAFLLVCGWGENVCEYAFMLTTGA